MGCGTSRIGDVTDPITDFFSGLVDEGYPTGTQTGRLPLSAENFEAFCLANLTDQAARVKAVSYFHSLIDKRTKPIDYTLFNLVMNITLTMGKFLDLSPTSLRFFAGLLRDDEVYTDTLTFLQESVITKKLALTARHVDTVIDSIDKYSRFPAAALTALDTYLASSELDIEAIVRRLFETYHSEITKTASAKDLSHHTASHAKEVERRARHVVFTKLNLWNSDSKKDRFLREVACLMIGLHDLVQRDPGEFASVELATASRVVAILVHELALEHNPELRSLIELMADQIIVAGTTMVYSPSDTTDLSHIFGVMKDAAIDAGYIDLPTEGPLAEFLRVLEVISLVTGICDKTPAALGPIAHFQHSDARVDSLSLVRRHSSSHPGSSAARPSTLLERFFNGDTFTRLFPREDGALNQQRFLISLGPHILMRAELSTGVAAAQLREFIRDCKAYSGTEPFATWYTKEFATKNIFDVLSAIFFHNIIKEANFSRSQRSGLLWVKARLTALLGLLAREELMGDETILSPLIDPDVASRDASNLEALFTFYSHLEPEEKIQFCRELGIVAIFQAGQLYSATSPAPRGRVSLPPIRAFLAPLAPTATGAESTATDGGEVTAGTGESRGRRASMFFRPLPAVPSTIDMGVVAAGESYSREDTDAAPHPFMAAHLSGGT